MNAQEANEIASKAETELRLERFDRERVKNNEDRIKAELVFDQELKEILEAIRQEASRGNFCYTIKVPENGYLTSLLITHLTNMKYQTHYANKHLTIEWLYD